MPFDNPEEEIRVPEVGGPPVRVIGRNIPPELVTFATAQGWTISMVDLWYQTATDYRFQALITGSGSFFMVNGTRTAANGIYITSTEQLGDAVNGHYVTFGFNPVDTRRQLHTYYATDIDLPSDPGTAPGGVGRVRVSESPSGFSYVLAGSNVSINEATGTLAHGTTSFANVPGVAAPTFDKCYAATDTTMAIEMSLTGFVSVVTIGFEIGIRIGAPVNTDVMLGKVVFSSLNVRQTIVGFGTLRDLGVALARGAYTITPRMRKSAGSPAGNIQVNGDDWLTLKLAEVSA